MNSSQRLLFYNVFATSLNPVNLFAGSGVAGITQERSSPAERSVFDEVLILGSMQEDVKEVMAEAAGNPSSLLNPQEHELVVMF